MSDEEDSMSEGFSASEDEWKPNNDLKGGESSDDDDSDFERSPLAVGGSCTSGGKRRCESKARSATKQPSSKKRTGLSLRAKLYNKYRPPPKTCGNAAGTNSPSASTSRKNSKNAIAPNESKVIRHKTDGEDSGSSSDSSIGNYLVNPEDLDIHSSFFNVEPKTAKIPLPVPVFDCNAGIEDLSDSASGEEKSGIKKDEKAFDFNNLLEYAKSLERVKESVAKHNAEQANKKKSSATSNIDSLNVYAVLALGEKQQNRSHNDGEDEDDEDDEGVDNETQNEKKQPFKLSKTKSTRIKRHTKTRPSSTVAANDTDDSDWEEVADFSEGVTPDDASHLGNLEIHVELPSRNREKKKCPQDIEMAFKRKLNRDMRERQVLLHKVSLLCRFGRIFYYNRLLNNTFLMQKALKLLPSKSAYPPENGTEIKYFQSMVTWFKGAIKLKSQNLYPEYSASTTKSKVIAKLLNQIDNKEASCKQDMIFMFIILLRGMGLQCRLVVNMQPIPLKPAQCDLLTIKIRGNKDKNASVSAKFTKKEESFSEHKTGTGLKAAENNAKNQLKGEKSSTKISLSPAHSKTNAESNKKAKKRKQNNGKEKEQQEYNDTERIEHNKNGTGVDSIKNSKQTRSRSKKININPNGKETNTSMANLNENSPKFEKEEDKNNIGGNPYEERTNSPSDVNENSVILDKPQNVISEENSNKIKIKKTEPAVKKVFNFQLNNSNEKKTQSSEENDNSKKENKTEHSSKPSLVRLKVAKRKENIKDCEEGPQKKPIIKPGSAVLPKVVVHSGNDQILTELPSSSILRRSSRSRSKSPQVHISSAFLMRGTHYKEKFPGITQQNTNAKNKVVSVHGPAYKAKISTDFLTNATNTQKSNDNKRVLRSRQKTNVSQSADPETIVIPQFDGANDNDGNHKKASKAKNSKKKQTDLRKLKAQTSESTDEDFEPSPPKKPKVAPASKKNRRVVSSDEENNKLDTTECTKRKASAGDMWAEVWCDVEEQWTCVDIFKGKIHCVDTIRKSASPSLAYVFAFQNDLSIKDVTARYCQNWATVLRKSRVENTWLEGTISKYLSHRTKRDIKEDQELRRIHEEKPMPSAISDYKNHPFYALERHLLKFEAIYPPNAPALGYVRGEAVYSRDCVHTLHSREIWLKQARTVKLGEKPYKIVKARPKWDRITQTVIKDQPLEIFGFWQTQDYEPPTAENGLVPRNAYGNVELFKPSMLPKKTKHIRLPGLNRICKKLGIDCANAVVGFDFHQGSCHPTYDGFVICEEFEDQVVAGWYQDQDEQERKEQEKYESRVYGNWKKLIRGLLIRERLKLKYNF